jgi:formylglycine-generating enzyme required for sulfatase activity
MLKTLGMVRLAIGMFFAVHVTVDQFAAFAIDSGYKTDAEKDGWSYCTGLSIGSSSTEKTNGVSWRHPNFDQKGDHPVVHVSWRDAQAFCDWLSKKCGKTVRLPTEAQWEYACRAGTTTAYPWGDNPDDGQGWDNVADQSLKTKFPNTLGSFFSWDDGFVFTSPVAHFRPNGFGLYDLNGNVWQWCQDCYGDYEKGAATDPTGAKEMVTGAWASVTGGLRVVRGGAWAGAPQLCRSANRHAGGAPDCRVDYYGFRVAVAGVD